VRGDDIWHIIKCHYLEIAADERNLDLDFAGAVMEADGYVIVGMKVRATYTSDPHRSPFLEGAKAIAGDKPIMVHLGEFPHTPVIDTDDLMHALRPGDVITHCFRGGSGLLDDDAKPTPAFRAAIDRGLKLDIGHSGGDFHFGTARHMIGLGILPDSISTDLNVFNIDQPVRSLPLTMSKLWGLESRSSRSSRWSRSTRPASSIGSASLEACPVAAAPTFPFCASSRGTGCCLTAMKRTPLIAVSKRSDASAREPGFRHAPRRRRPLHNARTSPESAHLL
jgi:predicted amidohydrolase